MPTRANPNETYDLAFPVRSNSWSAEEYTQDKEKIIWRSPYGLRYLSGNQDMHGGIDTDDTFLINSEIFDCGQNSPTAIYSLCDGYVYDFREEKNDVYIKCDQLLKYADGSSSPIYNIYRHLSSVKNEVKVTDELYKIYKGEYIGEMGSKGANSCHLHLDLKDENHYLHPGRLFNPNQTPFYQALKHEGDVDIRMLDFLPEENMAYFRIGVRGNVLSLLSIKITNDQMELLRILNFEEQNQVELEEERDNTEFDDWSIVAYPFNGYINAQSRYESVKESLLANYPGSSKRVKYYPISSNDHELYGEASMVYDITVKGVTSESLKFFSIQICDIYGNCILTDEI